MDTIAMFQKRKARFEKIVKTAFFVALIIDVAVIIILDILEISHPNGSYAVPVIALSFIGVVLTLILSAHKIYRCPSCNTIPTGSSGINSGLNMNPSKCHECGAKLS